MIAVLSSRRSLLLAYTAGWIGMVIALRIWV